MVLFLSLMLVVDCVLFSITMASVTKSTTLTRSRTKSADVQRVPKATKHWMAAYTSQQFRDVSVSCVGYFVSPVLAARRMLIALAKERAFTMGSLEAAIGLRPEDVVSDEEQLMGAVYDLMQKEAADEIIRKYMEAEVQSGFDPKRFCYKLAALCPSKEHRDNWCNTLVLQEVEMTEDMDELDG
jgi:hypothetical protein